MSYIRFILLSLLVSSTVMTNAQHMIVVQTAELEFKMEGFPKENLFMHLVLKKGVPDSSFKIYQTFDYNPGYETVRVKGKFKNGYLFDTVTVYNDRAQVLEIGKYGAANFKDYLDNKIKLDSISGYRRYGLFGSRDGLFKFYKSGKNFTNYKLQSEAEYKNGFLDGTKKIFHPDGSLQKMESYSNDTLNGPFQAYYSDGTLENSGNYIMGKNDGIFQYWYPNGQLRDSMFFKDGKLDGKTVSYFSDGKKKRIQHYKNYEWHGESWEWYHNGQLEWHSEYENGKRVGDYEYYDSLGNHKYLSNADVGVLDGVYLRENNERVSQFSFENSRISLHAVQKKKDFKLLQKAQQMVFECRVEKGNLIDFKVVQFHQKIAKRTLKKLLLYLVENSTCPGIYYMGKHYDGTLQFTIEYSNPHIR